MISQRGATGNSSAGAIAHWRAQKTAGQAPGGFAVSRYFVRSLLAYPDLSIGPANVANLVATIVLDVVVRRGVVVIVVGISRPEAEDCAAAEVRTVMSGMPVAALPVATLPVASALSRESLAAAARGHNHRTTGTAARAGYEVSTAAGTYGKIPAARWAAAHAATTTNNPTTSTAATATTAGAHSAAATVAAATATATVAAAPLRDGRRRKRSRGQDRRRADRYQGSIHNSSSIVESSSGGERANGRFVQRNHECRFTKLRQVAAHAHGNSAAFISGSCGERGTDVSG
jgi:hypothetical protein